MKISNTFILLLIFVLGSNPIFSQTIIFENEVKGIWTKAGSPYIILRPLTVPEDTSLIISPGVEVQFAAGCGMEILGNLLAVGDSDEKIVFTSSDTLAAKVDRSLGWNGIAILGENKDTCILKDCKIEYVYNYNTGFEGAININNRHAIINRCIIRNNIGDYIGAIYCSNEAVVLVMNSFISDNSKQWVFHGPGGINISKSKAFIINNLFYNNAGDIIIRGKNKDSDSVKIYNNTFVQTNPYNNYWNNNLVINDGGIMQMQNCIVWNYSAAKNLLVGVYDSEYTSIKNCIIQYGRTGIQSDNSKIQNINTYEGNPYFEDVNNRNFKLTDSSYAINSGFHYSSEIHNLIPYDLANNPRIFDDQFDKIDIGAYEYQGDIITNRPPTIKNPGIQHMFVSSTKSLTFDFFDVDENDKHTLAVTTDNPRVSILSTLADPYNAKYTLIPENGWSGTANIILSVTDSFGVRDIDTFALIVSDTLKSDITESTVWFTDTVFIGNNINVHRDVTLEIQPGTHIFFNDFYQMQVEGVIKAIGLPDSKIFFTATDTSGFKQNLHKGWGGFVLKNTLDTSVFNHCIFEYEKDRNVILLNEETSADIINCIFRYNITNDRYNYPSTIRANISSGLYIGNTLFYDNLSQDATLKTYESDITLCNNVFYNNSGQSLYATEFGISNSRNVLIKNCIFWKNNTRNKPEILAFSTVNMDISHCVIENGEAGISTINPNAKRDFIYNVYPLFADTLNRNLHLLSNSPCIDIGINNVQLTKLNNLDMDGNNRIFNGLAGIPDIGAYELQETSSNRQPILEQTLDKNAMVGNPITCTVHFFDADEADIHTITIESDDINVSIQNLSGDTTGSVYTLVPAPGFEGNVTISVKVEDNGGLYDSITYNLLVSQNACGNIDYDMVWDDDTINVVCDITVEDGATLTINPGVKVVFHGPYCLNVKGNLLAEGAVGDTILFTLTDSITFNDTIQYNAWRGIKFNPDREQDTSRLEYCEIRYSTDHALELLYKSKVVVSECNIHYNIINDYNKGGSGIYINYSGYSIIQNNYVHHNKTNSRGGGLYINEGYYNRILNNMICHNTSRSGGGGIYSYSYSNSNTIIEGNIIENNYSRDIGGGGGIYTSGGDIIRSNKIRNNYSYNGGGGIYAYKNATILNNIVEGNTSEYGGGLGLTAGYFDVINNSITKNHGRTSGAGILMESAGGLVINNTICNNASGSAGNGIFLGGDKAPKLVNNIIWGNRAHGTDIQVFINDYASQPEMSHCILEGGKDNIQCSTGIYYTCEYKNNLDIYPNFSDTANGIFNLSDSSICINSGIEDTTGLRIPDTDIAGHARIYNGNIRRIDIGAYEYQDEPVNRPPVLNSLQDIHLFISQTKQMKAEYFDPDDGNTHSLIVESDEPHLTIENLSGNASGSTYDLVASSGWYGYATIKVKVEDNEGLADSAYYMVTVNDSVCGNIIENTLWETDTVIVTCNIVVREGKTLTIKKGTVVAFNGYYNIEVIGSLIAEGTENDSILFIPCVKTNIEPDDLWGGIQFRKKYCKDTSKLSYCKIMYSRGVKIYYDNVIVSNCLFSKNYTNNGGGICVYNSSPVIENCTFINNAVSNTGGGISCIDEDDFDYIYTNPVIIKNQFISNNASHGGGIYCVGWNTKPCIIQNTFYNNHARYGGGLYLGDDIRELIIENNLVIKNTAGNDGGGIYFDVYSQTLINNTIANNHAGRNGGGLYFNKYVSSSFYNCIIYFNRAGEAGSQVYLLDRNSDPSFYYSFLQYGKDGIKGDGAGIEYNGRFISVISEDPLFADTTSNDFQLTDSSLCVNSGTLNIQGIQIPACDIIGNSRIYAGIAPNIDVGAYEFQGSARNRKPVITRTTDQYTQISQPKTLSVYFIDVDKTDVHVISISTDNANVMVENKSGNISGSTYDLVPINGWEGIAKVFVRVEDDNGNFAADTFSLTVSEFYCGSITQNTVWGADTIKIRCDVTIEEGATLTIMPGTVILFDEYARLNIYGRLLAIGTKESRIIFTSSDTSSYGTPNYKGWRGVRFNGPSGIDTSQLVYCVIKYAKGWEIDNSSEKYGGGIFINNWGRLIISDCQIYNNSAVEYGGGVYCVNSNAKIVNSVISNNYSGWAGGGLYISGNYPNLYLINNIICNNLAAIYGGGINGNDILSFNNMIVNNRANYGGGLYINNGRFYNTILWGNVAVDSHNQLSAGNSSVYLYNCVLQGGTANVGYSLSTVKAYENMIEQNPQFAMPSLGSGNEYNGLHANWVLQASSPCINMGTTVIDIYDYQQPATDIVGETRILMDSIDIGPYEYRNSPPYRINKMPDLQVYAGADFDITIVVDTIFNDDNVGDILTYSAVALNSPDWMDIILHEENIYISGTPASSDTGNYMLIAAAYDLYDGVAFDTVLLAVIEPSAVLSFQDNSFKIYPIPASDNIYIESQSDIENMIPYKLFDAEGKTILSECAYTTNRMTIDVSNIPAGIYYLSIQWFGESKIVKIQKIK
ncbi:MAG: right-handed parallel beta-helix repeat-containing protein [Bacteroidales bacterium]|nr:right-handed parallel beta-helix repeat-containing protein [Bacteroidales bacterium]